MKFSAFGMLVLAQIHAGCAFVPASFGSHKIPPRTQSSDTRLDAVVSRKDFLSIAPVAALGVAVPTLFPGSPAVAATGPTDGNLPDLPRDAVRSYLQYRIPLQIAADAYIFSYQEMISDIEQWGEVSQLFRVNNNKGQGQPSKIERDYNNPMKVLLLSFPPDVSDEMREAQFRFEKAMNNVSKATAGYKKDLPVEIDPKSIVAAKQGWEDGRLALNDFFALVNKEVGLSELKTIPLAGPNQFKEYGRSARRFNELQKKTKLCQNRYDCGCQGAT
jgi:hypothetical protein